MALPQDIREEINSVHPDICVDVLEACKRNETVVMDTWVNLVGRWPEIESPRGYFNWSAFVYLCYRNPYMRNQWDLLRGKHPHYYTVINYLRTQKHVDAGGAGQACLDKDVPGGALAWRAKGGGTEFVSGAKGGKGVSVHKIL